MSKLSLVSKTFGGVQTGKFAREAAYVNGSGSNLITLTPSASTVFINTSGATANLILPAVAQPGTDMSVLLVVAGNNALLAHSSGNTFNGTLNSVTLSGQNQGANFVYVSQTAGWLLTGIIGGATLA